MIKSFLVPCRALLIQKESIDGKSNNDRYKIVFKPTQRNHNLLTNATHASRKKERYQFIFQQKHYVFRLRGSNNIHGSC